MSAAQPAIPNAASLTREQYDAATGINWSALKHMGRSPAHYQQAQATPMEDTDALRLGRCVSMAVFEPDIFGARVAVWDGGRRAGKEWQAFCQANAGREILTEEQYAQCIAIQRAVGTDPTASKWIREGRGEVSAQWIHTVAGRQVLCKGRLDCVAPPTILDLKTTRDASPEAFGRQSWGLEYHAQAAWYVDGWELATGKRLPYALVAVEKEAPWAVQVYTVPEHVLEIGRQRYRDLLRRLVQCKADNQWPGYSTGPLELTVPRWAGVSHPEDNIDGLGLVIEGASK